MGPKDQEKLEFSTPLDWLRSTLKFNKSIANKNQKQPFRDILQNRFLKNFAIFTGKNLCWSQAPTQLFSCEYCKIFKNSLFYRIPPVAGSEKLKPTQLKTQYKKKI